MSADNSAGAAELLIERATSDDGPILFRRAFAEGSLMHAREVANCLIDGPWGLIVQRRSADRERFFERVLRITRRVPNERLEAWSLYRREREWDTHSARRHGCVVRHARWETADDLARRPWMEGKGPTIVVEMRYVPARQCAALASAILALDHVLVTGVALTRRRERPRPKWFEFSVLRLRDSATFDLLWNSSLANEACEAAAASVERTLTGIMAADPVPVAQLRQVFDWTPYLRPTEDRPPYGAPGRRDRLPSESPHT